MDANTVTLIVGLGGIISTTAVSIIGYYYTSKARSSERRNKLFQYQLDMAIKITSLIGKVRTYFEIINDDEGTGEIDRDLLIKKIAKAIFKLNDYREEGATFFPVEIYGEIAKVRDSINSIFINYPTTKTIDATLLRTFLSHTAKLELLFRIMTGADELTEQSIKLFSKSIKLEQVGQIDPLELYNHHKEKEES